MPFVFTTALLSTIGSTFPNPSSALDSNAVGQEVGYFAGLIDKYGPVTIILSIFCICFIILLLVVIKNYKKLINDISNSKNRNDEFNQELVDKLIESYLKKNSITTKTEVKEAIEETSKKEEDSHKSVVSVYINAQLAFKDASRIAISRIKCQRVAIYLFHNGNHTPFGFPFAKMSCVHEWTMKGTATVRGHDHIGIPLYAFSDMVESLSDNGEYVVENIYDHSVINSDEQVFQFVSGSNTQSLFAVAIKNQDGCLAAFTVAEFKDPQDFSDENRYNEVKEALKTMNDNIYSIVINDEFNKNYSGES